MSNTIAPAPRPVPQPRPITGPDGRIVAVEYPGADADEQWWLAHYDGPLLAVEDALAVTRQAEHLMAVS